MPSNSTDLVDSRPSADVADERNSNPAISFLIEDGTRRVLSRYHDPVWNLSPYALTANKDPSETLIRWSTLPPGFVC